MSSMIKEFENYMEKKLPLSYKSFLLRQTRDTKITVRKEEWLIRQLSHLLTGSGNERLYFEQLFNPKNSKAPVMNEPLDYLSLNHVLCIGESSHDQDLKLIMNPFSMVDKSGDIPAYALFQFHTETREARYVEESFLLLQAHRFSLNSRNIYRALKKNLRNKMTGSGFDLKKGSSTAWLKEFESGQFQVDFQCSQKGWCPEFGTELYLNFTFTPKIITRDHFSYRLHNLDLTDVQKDEIKRLNASITSGIPGCINDPTEPSCDINSQLMMTSFRCYKSEDIYSLADFFCRNIDCWTELFLNKYTKQKFD